MEFSPRLDQSAKISEIARGTRDIQIPSTAVDTTRSAGRGIQLHVVEDAHESVAFDFRGTLQDVFFNRISLGGAGKCPRRRRYQAWIVLA